MDPYSEAPRLIVWDGSGNSSHSDQQLLDLAQRQNVDIPEKGILTELTIDSCWAVIQEMGFIKSTFVNQHWCRFRNVAVTTSNNSNACSLRFREISSLLLLPAFAADVKDRLAPLNDAQDETSPATSSVAAISHSSPKSPTAGSTRVQLVVPEFILKNVPVTTLAEVAKSTAVPRKYHCFTTFKAMWPSDIAKVSKSKPGTQGAHVYSFVLTIQDNTGTVDVIVYGSDAVRFVYNTLNLVGNLTSWDREIL